MYFLHGTIFFVLGAIIGSFLNVVVLRWGTGLSFSRGRSKCFSCGKTLRPYELFPIVSFFLLRGRCGSCKSPLSLQYPAVELLTGLLFLALFFRDIPLSSLSAGVFFILHACILSVLVVISVYDIRHKIIPDTFSAVFALLALVLVTWGPSAEPVGSMLLAGPLLSLPFAALWYFSKGRLIGLGDAKLVLGIGWFLGIAYGLSAVILGFWIGAAYSLLLIAGQHLLKRDESSRLHMKSEIPFGPFLVLGTLLVFFFEIDVIGLHTFLAL